ncbi:prolyl 4-hydroxylase subunit alpha-2 [Ixodes scapularis]
MSTLSDLISMEKLVKTDLLRYVERLKVVQDSILNFVHDKQPYDDFTSPSAVSEYLKHPVHAFHLIKRMTSGLGVIEALINKTRKFDPLVNVMEMRKQRLLPWDEDFTGLAGSLVRLQDMYALDLHELTKGHIRTEIPRNRSVPGRLPLNARDCFNISQVALRHGFYDRAVEWAEQAIAKAAEEEPPTIPKQELDTFYKDAIKEHDEVLRTAGEVGDDWQTYGVPVRERANRTTQFKAQLFDEEIEDDQVTENYKRLCRGEQLRLEQSKTLCAASKDGPPRRTSSNTWLNDDDAPVAARVNQYLQSLLGLGTLYSKDEAEKYQTCLLTHLPDVEIADPLVNVMEMRKQRLLPWDEDFTGLAGSLVRLQDMYALDLHELTKGHIRTEIPRNRSVPGRLPLNARDCFNISQVALRHGFYDRAVEWAEQAIAKAAEEEPPTIPKQELDTFYKDAIKEHDEVLRTAGEVGDDWQTYGVPVRERANRTTQFKAQLFDEEIEDDQVTENYKRLCRGEQLRLEQSKTLCAASKDGPPRRTSSNTWLNDDDAPVAARVNQYLQSLLGLGTLYSKDEAEKYQLANYGIGGHYVPHHDYLAETLTSRHRLFGDRVATLMIYMSDVEEGGATVFPSLGVRVSPKKGDAVFWWNIKSNWEGDLLTWHAGCPVLYGSKWIANKWFGSYSNVFRMPCSTNQNASLGPLV